MDKIQNPIDLIYQIKGDGLFTKENEKKIYLALCMFGQLMKHLLTPEDEVNLKYIELYATGNLSEEAFDKICQNYRHKDRSNVPSLEARAPITLCLISKFNEADYDDYLGYSVAFCRLADNTISDSEYSRILTNIFYE